MNRTCCELWTYWKTSNKRQLLEPPKNILKKQKIFQSNSKCSQRISSLLLKIWEHQDLMKPMVKHIWGKVPAVAREFVYNNHCVSFVVNLPNKILIIWYIVCTTYLYKLIYMNIHYSFHWGVTERKLWNKVWKCFLEIKYIECTYL